ncbi:HD-GYP domain-containing protein [Thermodesulfovibrio yellowstonii]|uniref:HD-GYP domain-containing protein n=1 Tax=Thermodesulfovibrio yellowstonii TaxID=28262 RepID=UPI00041BE6E2|nr:HD domain-containing phosphohydrolase [Thermodesulfovibrio islandicus]
MLLEDKNTTKEVLELINRFNNSSPETGLLFLSVLAEQKNGFDLSHVIRVQEIARRVAEVLTLPDAEIIGKAAACHDVGKLGIPKELLQLDRELLKWEFDVIKRHPVLGAEIIEGISTVVKRQNKFLQYAREIALWHHEKCDGTGYPHGLTSKEIPIHVKITTVVDIFDALTSWRPYKFPWDVNAALTYLEENAEKFDADVLKAFKEVVNDILKETEKTLVTTHAHLK